MNNFDLRQFLTENKLTANSKILNELALVLGGRLEDIESVRFENKEDSRGDNFQAYMTGVDNGNIQYHVDAPDSLMFVITFKDGKEQPIRGEFIDAGIAAPVEQIATTDDIENVGADMEFYYYTLDHKHVFEVSYTHARGVEDMGVRVIDRDDMILGVYR